jgi:hypothetical protein
MHTITGMKWPEIMDMKTDEFLATISYIIDKNKYLIEIQKQKE